MSTDADGSSDQPSQYMRLTYRQRVVDFTKRVAGGPVIGLIVCAVFLLAGIPRSDDGSIAFSTNGMTLHWYFIPYAIAFAGSLVPFWRYIRGSVNKGAGLIAWGVELLRVVVVITWMSMVFSLDDGAVIWSAGSLVVLILLAAAFKSSVRHCLKRSTHKVLPAA